MNEDDALVNQAIEIVQQSSRASVSLLQRKLRIGYSIASNLIDQLEALGIVGPDEGPTRGRAVLKNEEPNIRGSLYLVAEVFGEPQERGDLERELIETTRRAYAASHDSIALGLVQAIRAANDFFYTINANRVPEARRIAGITAAILRGNELVIAQGGPGVTCLIRGNKLSRYPDTSPWFVADLVVVADWLASRNFQTSGAVPLGMRRNYSPDLFNVSLQSGDIIVLATRFLAHPLMTDELLDVIAHRHSDELIMSIQNVADESDVSVIALRIGSKPVPPTTPAKGMTLSSTEAPRLVSLPNEENLKLLNQLNSLIGLEAVKKDVAELINFIKVQQLRKAKGLPAAPTSLHQVFYGNPGTGKTTVARILSQIFKSMNLLSKGHLIETDRSGLVAGYVGQTALKVTEVVNQALGGVLFIDEAYSLAGQGQDYGQEAIETLLKQMEDHRDDLVVIVAGYTDRMNEFLSSNPGLRSRFNRYLRFDDYTPLQLVAIFESFCTQAGYHLSPTTKEKLQSVFGAAYAKRDKTFGNARFARNLFERTISNQANRVVALPNANPQVFSTIEIADIPDKVTDDLT